MAYHVFISYRRQGASELALLLHARLAAKGYSPFLDMEGMRSGSFNSQLYERIDECSDVLVLIPPKGLEPSGRDEDWFRLEIAYALQKGKNVIPVMMRGFEWPEEKDELVEQLHYRQGLEVSTEYFDAMFAKLCRLITYKPASKTKRMLAIVAAAVAVAACVGIGLYVLYALGFFDLSDDYNTPGTYRAVTATPLITATPTASPIQTPSPTLAPTLGHSSGTIYVQTIRDCLLYEEINSWDGACTDAELGEIFVYNGETLPDENGVAWYALEYFGATYWISSEDGVLVNCEQALQNHPTFFGNLMWGIEEEGSSRKNEQTGEWVYLDGLNDRGMLVDWFVECYASPFADMPNAVAPKVLSCSWTDDLQECGSMLDEAIWQAVLEGKTLYVSEYRTTWAADIGELRKEQMVSRIFLPDDPSIEGRQSIVYRSGNDTVTFTFDLVYIGGYSSNGRGWKAENIEMNR